MIAFFVIIIFWLIADDPEKKKEPKKYKNRILRFMFENKEDKK